MVGCISLADLALPTIFFWSCGQAMWPSSGPAAAPVQLILTTTILKPNLLTCSILS